MTIALLMILANILLIFGLITALTTSYKWIAAILLISPIYIAFYAGSINNKQQSVDLPEEHQQISHNSNKPDILLGYYRGDTLVITFKH